ncbi:alpha/beta fold hydrolase [Cryobacterium tepidiphilum]|uniref:Alpha/beta fold hydrolase n=1 Tax=Cryobacterium tepidiphilum TaxID=2486026 RepID=A0A3M8LNI1_9MICO|nr:alpha/beta fold hydrolase [Cryobacterium tepidiphilum]
MRSPRASASLPPAGLPGLDPRFSRIVDVPESGGARGIRQWHVLDNGAELHRLGVTPVGTVVCVHGNPTWSYLWRRFLTAATDAAAAGGDAWRVIAVDQLEMGFSERSGYSRSLEQRVRDLTDLTDAVGLDGPVVTFGHDWGGLISLGWAVDHPGQLAGVMLLNTAVHQPEGAQVPAPLRLALARPVLGLATVTTPGFLETTLALAHPPLPAAVKDGYRAPYRSADRRGGIGAFVADIPVDDRHESTAERVRIAEGVRGFTVPALLLWGPRDPIFSDRYLDDLIERLPHADVHRFEGAGHLVAEDVDYAAAAVDWLAHRLPGATTPSADAASVSTRAPRTPARPPLWRRLEELADSEETALVEMVPAPGSPPRVVSWQLLATRVRQLTAGLARAGVRPGDRVSLLVPPGADLTAVLYACLRLGAVVVVADAGLGLRGLTRAVRGARPTHLIGALPGLTAARALGWPGQRISTARLPAPLARALGVSHSLADLVELGADEALPPEPAPGDTAAILFTSGSTGPAKGVVYTHDQLAAVRDALAAQYGIGVGTGLVAGFAPFALLGPALGARSVTPDMDVTSPKTLTATAVADAVAAADARVVFLSPAAVANVVATAGALTPEGRTALRRVQTFLSAGAPVSERLLDAVAALMPDARLHTPYGMTEGLLMTDVTLDGIREAAGEGGPGGVCVGVPAAPTEVRISALDADGNATGEPTDAAGVTGEIIVSAPHLKDHYDRLWLTNRAATQHVPAAGRWHRTGDVGHLDAAGRLWVEGRLPHVITTADGPLTPVGAEQRIEGVPAVWRAAIVGVGPRGVQQPVAIVETRLGTARVALASAELADAVRAASEQELAAVLVVPHLPTDIRHNSKIDRSRLAAWATRILAGGRMARP